MFKKLLLYVTALVIFSAHADAQYVQPVLGNPILEQSSTAAESNHIMNAAPGNLHSYGATSGASSGYVMIFDSATVPADGAVVPKKCFPIAANSAISGSYYDYPSPFLTGIVMVFSTTGCFTKTASSTAFFNAQVR